MGNAKTEKRKQQYRNNDNYAGKSNAWKQRTWARQYRKEIQEGKQHCRACLVVATDLTFDHMIPASQGGPGTLNNITILCEECQRFKGDSYWPFLISLGEEQLRKHGGPPTPFIRRVKAPFHIEKLRENMNIEKPEPLTQRIVVPPQVSPKIIDHSVNERIDRLEQLVVDSAKAYQELERDLRVAFDRIKVLEDMKGVSSPTLDPLYVQIVDLLKSYHGLKMNTGTIAENLGTNSMKISDKLKTLVLRGLVKTEKREGASAMFWWEAPTEATTEEVN